MIRESNGIVVIRIFHWSSATTSFMVALSQDTMSGLLRQYYRSRKPPRDAPLELRLVCFLQFSALMELRFVFGPTNH